MSFSSSPCFVSGEQVEPHDTERGGSGAASARSRYRSGIARLGSVVVIAVVVVLGARRIVPQADKVEKAVPKSWVGHVKARRRVGQGSQRFGTQEEARHGVRGAVLGGHPWVGVRDGVLWYRPIGCAFFLEGPTTKKAALATRPGESARAPPFGLASGPGRRARQRRPPDRALYTHAKERPTTTGGKKIDKKVMAQDAEKESKKSFWRRGRVASR